MAEQVIAKVLTALAEETDAAIAEQESAVEPTFYDALAVPRISILELLRRWMKFSGAPNEVLVMAVILIDRAVAQGVRVRSVSMHRILLAALVVATKNHVDRVFCNQHYAKVGGVDPKELFRLESSFLNDIEWNTFITPEAFDGVCKAFSRKMKKSSVRSSSK
eukprot:gene22765-34877_t